ncbi:MAG: mannose-1-phosphate guanylyltransferase [Candidatus Dormibacteria bacterium]
MILAGGSGTRLWPLSRAALPKHLAPLAPDGRSLLRHAYERAERLGGVVLVVTARDQVPQVLAELPELDPSLVLAEPEPRGTGPALAWAASWALAHEPEAVLVSLHADHYLPDLEATEQALAWAASWAKSSQLLVAIGVEPRHPTTGYGYIRLGAAVSAPEGLDDAPPVFWGTFAEKPDRAQAEAMLRQGGHLWNTGLFAWPAALFLAELARYAPQVAGPVGEAAALETGGDFARAWSRVPPGVVERLVLERSQRMAALPTDLAWTDLGSFLDLHQVALAAGRGDAEDNVVTGDALLLGSRDNFVESAGARLVALVACQGMAVVDGPDALLVCPLDRVQEVSQLVQEMRRQGRRQVL